MTINDRLKELTEIYLLCQKVIIRQHNGAEQEIFANVSDEMQQIARHIRLAIAYIEWKKYLDPINPKKLKPKFPNKEMSYSEKVNHIKERLRTCTITFEDNRELTLALEEIIKALVLIQHFIKYEKLKSSDN